MKCPHCHVTIHEGWNTKVTFDNSELSGSQYKTLKWRLISMTCPSCDKDIIAFQNLECNLQGHLIGVKDEKMVYPEGINRHFPSTNVPEIFRKDYIEAAKVIHLSEVASAALSRRCLQNIIHNHLGIKSRDLKQEIQEIRNQGKLPTEISDQLDHLREIGNFAAHPKKDSLTGEIIDVDQGEAEWTLDILDEIFDFCFDRPARIAAKKAGWDAKKSKALK